MIKLLIEAGWQLRATYRGHDGAAWFWKHPDGRAIAGYGSTDDEAICHCVKQAMLQRESTLGRV